jgi:hypothetical protein
MTQKVGGSEGYSVLAKPVGFVRTVQRLEDKQFAPSTWRVLKWLIFCVCFNVLEMDGVFANQTTSRGSSLTVLSDNSDGKVMVNDKLEGIGKETAVT